MHSLNSLKGTLHSSAMFKIQFWASSWHEEKNWDIETEDPETIHASRIILFIILLMLLM